uniref:galactose-specific lectin nattectin-like n=1 Tax=Centroberyx gerrardi TaxID=166262 RepID=UPI003AAE4153
MSLLLHLLCLLGVAAGSEGVKLQRGSCPMFWYSFSGRCYKYVATDMNWADAELHCVSQGANLVSVHSAGEFNFVQNLIHNFDPAMGFTWIGLSDIHKENGWMWSDGSKVVFTRWYAGQPDNYQQSEHCVSLADAELSCVSQGAKLAPQIR